MNSKTLVLVLLAVTALPLGIAQSQVQTLAPPQFEYHAITKNDVRVTLVETATILAARGIQTTSLIFVIEHLGKNKIQRGTSNVNFLDSNATLIFQEVPSNKELVKSGSGIHNYSSYRSPWQTKLPEPEDKQRAYVVQQWFRTPIPKNAKFLSVTFSGEKFKFLCNGG